MKKIKKPHYIIPIFVPHSGCPHDCIFCNQKKITDQLTEMNSDKAIDVIDEYLGYFNRDAYIEIAFYGGSFTAIDLNRQKDLLKIAYDYKSRGLVDEIRMSTRPDAISREILIHLKEYKVDTVELGVQSMDLEVLNLSGRGHNSEIVYKAVRLLKEYDFKVGLQMMLGLPGDSRGKSLYTAEEFIKLNPDCVRIYPTLVIKDTYLEDLYINGKYQPLSIEDAVELSALALILFEEKDINVIRMGLQATENMQLGRDIIAGPFHPAFGHLVESYIYKRILDNKLADKKEEVIGRELKLYANNSMISNIVGQKASNKNYLIEKYKLKDLKFYGIADLSADRIKIDCNESIININILEGRQILLKEELKN